MRERFIRVDDQVYWIEVERYIMNIPTYKIVQGYYLGSYAMGSYSRCICTPSITSCVVRHVDPQYVFINGNKALKMLEKMNNESMESN